MKNETLGKSATIVATLLFAIMFLFFSLFLTGIELYGLDIITFQILVSVVWISGLKSLLVVSLLAGGIFLASWWETEKPRTAWQVILRAFNKNSSIRISIAETRKTRKT